LNRFRTLSPNDQLVEKFIGNVPIPALREVVDVAKEEKKNKGESSKNAKELKDKKSSPTKKSAAASALAKSSEKKDKKKDAEPKKSDKKADGKSTKAKKRQRRKTGEQEKVISARATGPSVLHLYFQSLLPLAAVAVYWFTSAICKNLHPCSCRVHAYIWPSYCASR